MKLHIEIDTTVQSPAEALADLNDLGRSLLLAFGQEQTASDPELMAGDPDLRETATDAPNNGPELDAPAPQATDAPNNGPELDADGLPWDERIHASTRAKNKDGTWRNKRGVDDSTVATVTAELQQTMGAAPPAPATDAPLPPPAPADAAPRAGLIGRDAQSDTTFPQLMAKITSACDGGQIDMETADMCAQRCGLPNLVSLYSRPDLIGNVERHIDHVLNGGDV